MVLECGNIIIVCSDEALLSSELNDLGYQYLNIEVISEDKRRGLNIRINSGLTLEQKLQAVVINTVARLTFDPNKSKDAWVFNYVPFEIRLVDYNEGYWEKLICGYNGKIRLNTSMIIGRGLPV